MNISVLTGQMFSGFPTSAHTIGATTKWLLSISIVCTVSGCDNSNHMNPVFPAQQRSNTHIPIQSPDKQPSFLRPTLKSLETLSTLRDDQFTRAAYGTANRWRKAIEHWSQPNRENIFYRAGNSTNCDSFVRRVFSDYGIAIFREGSVDQLYLKLRTQWRKLLPYDAAEQANEGIPTIALTTNDDPPKSHIVVLLGGRDTRGYPNVRGAGAYSGPRGKPHGQRHGQYRGGVYDGLVWHWQKIHHKHIQYFSMPAGQLANAR